MKVRFKKLDDSKQVLYSEVYAPGVPDSQGDFMTADEIEQMAWNFMQSGNLRNIDREHDQRFVHGDCVVESFIARTADPDFIPGAWVVAIHVPDPMQWAMVKNGTYNGLSMDGDADRLDKNIELEMPDKLEGMTSVTKDHEHRFVVAYSPDGEFLGGVTDVVQGHQHLISRGTVTNEADGHTHRFSYVEQIHGQN